MPGRNSPSLAPDDDVFKHLASVYSNTHLTMHKGFYCHDERFEGGITNGAAWYPLTGVYFSFLLKSGIHIGGSVVLCLCSADSIMI